MPDREKVIKALEYCIAGDCVSCFYRQQCIKTGIKRDAIVLLKEQEAVVRCKDCKCWNEENNSYYGRCERIRRLTPFDWFCADGERKDD